VDVSLIILDGFYNNPDAVREFALTQRFENSLSGFGKRSEPFITEDIKEIVERVIHNHAGNIVRWDDDLSGCFFSADQNDRNEINSNSDFNWFGVCFLTPDAPLLSGIGTFKHKMTKSNKIPTIESGEVDFSKLQLILKDAKDMTKWESMDLSVNLYNRLVLFKGDLFHTFVNPFGNCLQNGLLYQTFYFSTEF
jgi:hypothetical protein